MALATRLGIVHWTETIRYVFLLYENFLVTLKLRLRGQSICLPVESGWGFLRDRETCTSLSCHSAHNRSEYHKDTKQEANYRMHKNSSSYPSFFPWRNSHSKNEK